MKTETIFEAPVVIHFRADDGFPEIYNVSLYGVDFTPEQRIKFRAEYGEYYLHNLCVDAMENDFLDRQSDLAINSFELRRSA